MKKATILIAALSLSIGLTAQNQNPTYLSYIEQWKATAIENQAEYGIPASIIMAQALLESGAGQSELATNANNHFGIKCANEWLGAVYYYDDDSKGECFRQYANAAESFKDHALFLQRPRYATCFEIVPEDYEGWAYRLKECGYATDKNYAPKLIKIIEDYRLDTLVSNERVKELTNEQPEAVSPVNDEPAAPGVEGNGQSTESKVERPAANAKSEKAKRPLKAEVVHRSEPIMVIHNDPEPEYKEPLTAKQEKDSFMLSHPKKKYNGVPYVLAREGDTYANVAYRLNVRERDLRVDNDALGRDLLPGDRIFLSAKKTKGTKDYIWTYPGLSLWKLSQEEGMMIETIQKLNGLDPTIRTFRTRQKLYLKKVKDDGQR